MSTSYSSESEPQQGDTRVIITKGHKIKQVVVRCPVCDKLRWERYNMWKSSVRLCAVHNRELNSRTFVVNHNTKENVAK